MTTEARFDRQLPAVLEDLYLGPTPDYRNDVLAAATAKRQRPAWTFPGRWLPMADIASRPTFAPRVPWRTIGVAFVIIALLLAAAVIYVGSRQTRLPPPFGVARNGSIAWAKDGNIYAGDPIAGTTRAIVVGDEVDQNPIYSRDGTKLAFFRQVANQVGLYDLAVVGRDGGEVSIISAEPIRIPALAEWAPDGTAILINDADDRLLRFDATRKALPRVIALGARIRGGAFRPPDSGQVLIERDTVNGTGLYLLNSDGSGVPTTLIEAGPATNGGAPTLPAWSPNGRYVAFRVGTEGAPQDDVRMYVIRADGTGMLKLDSAPGYWVESDVVWSPDSTQIAFNRWQYSDTAAGHQIRPIGVVQVTGGSVVGVGSTPVPDGALFDYSPDGSTLLSLPGNVPSVFNWSDGAVGTVVRPELIDVNDGTARQLDLDIDSAASWQRLAPEH